MLRRLAAAGATLLLLGAASWLPALAARRPAAAAAFGDLARPALSVPSSLPAVAGSALGAVTGLYFSLAAAVTARQTATARPQGEAEPPAVSEDFARAYAHLAGSWRSQLPFAAFVRSWSATRGLDLLAALPAGAPAGEPFARRVFVEIRTLTWVGGAAPHMALGYAYAFCVAEVETQGWLVRSAQLTPENFGAAPSGQVPQAEAEAAAVAAARHAGRSTGDLSPRVGKAVAQSEHRLTVPVRVGEDLYTVILYQLVDGSWVVLQTTR